MDASAFSLLQCCPSASRILAGTKKMVRRLLGFILQKATRTALSVTEPWPKCKAIILSIYMDTCTAASSTAWALNLIFHTHDAWVFGLGSITVDAYRSDRPRLASSCSLLLVRTRCSEATAASSKSTFLREKEATTDIFQSALCLACFPELPSSRIALWSSKKTSTQLRCPLLH